MITTKDIISKLTDVFVKDPNSNLGKLCSIMADQLRKVQETNKRVQQWKNIDLAKGTTLDMIGSNIGQPRGIATDEVYRIMIKSKVAVNFSTSDINTIIRVLSIALDSPYSDIRIEEMYTDTTTPEPAAIKVIELPLERINHAGMTPSQFVRIVKRTVAAGIRVGVIELTGTFEFGSTDTVDPEKGFADLAGTYGGYLGAAVSGDDEDLPI